MGYQFHTATEVVTALCPYCKKRFNATKGIYKRPTDKEYLNKGISGMLRYGKPYKEDRYFEIYCSIYCSKRHKANKISTTGKWYMHLGGMLSAQKREAS